MLSFYLISPLPIILFPPFATFTDFPRLLLLTSYFATFIEDLRLGNIFYMFYAIFLLDSTVLGKDIVLLLFDWLAKPSHYRM